MKKVRSHMKLDQIKQKISKGSMLRILLENTWSLQAQPHFLWDCHIVERLD